MRQAGEGCSVGLPVMKYVIRLWMRCEKMCD